MSWTVSIQNDTITSYHVLVPGRVPPSIEGIMLELPSSYVCSSYKNVLEQFSEAKL